jgi:hypothetical protein
LRSTSIVPCASRIRCGNTGRRRAAGFIEPIVNELPLEYAVEMNRLIQIQMEGSDDIGKPE